MSTPKFYYGGNGQRDSLGDDKAGTYADQSGHVLHFEDARRSVDQPQNFVTFIAFLTSFSQAFSSNWNTEEVYGRMDPIATFKNTTRKISVAWDIPAKSKVEAEDNLQRCNQLISMLYPTYARQDDVEPNALAMSKPPLIRMRYSNLIQGKDGLGLLGFINAVNWNPIIEMGYFHTQGKMFPKVIQISIEFQAIHANNLGWDKDNKSYSGTGTGEDHKVNWPFK